MSDRPAELADKLATAISILNWELADMWGHVTARTPGGDGFYLRHLRPPEHRDVPADDVLEFDLEGSLRSGKRNVPDEVYFYSVPFSARPEVGAVVHCHPQMALALTAAGRQIVPIHQNSVKFGRGVPITPWLYGYWKQHGEQAVAAMGDNCAVMISGHGVIVTGATIEEACITTVHLERTARMLLAAAAIGPVETISEEVARQYKGVVGSTSEGVPPEERWRVPMRLEWQYYERLVKAGERWSRL